jgi:hypothetical protein
MLKHSKWIAITLALFAVGVGAQYVRAAGGHHATVGAATTISPTDLTRAAGTLPVTLIESYF